MPQYSGDHQIAEESYNECMNDIERSVTPAAFFGRLNREEQIEILEAARIGLQDENLLDLMDLADEDAQQLVVKLQEYMD